jgi:pristinamycin I synthase 3 and 4
MSKTAIEGYRISRQQGDLWRVLQADGDVAYRVQAKISIKGSLDELILQAALSKVLKRHEILRTTFQRLAGRSVAVQVIGNATTMVLDRVDLTHSDSGQQDAAIESLVEDLRRVPFDFEKGPLFYARLVRLSGDSHALLLGVSALCADRVTLNNVIQEIAEAYSSVNYVDTSEAMQYADFAQWQSEVLDSKESESGKRYWSKRNIAEGLGNYLPFRRPKEKSEPFLPDNVTIPLREGLDRKIEALARNNDVLSSDVLLSAWIVLIWRLTGRSRIVVGAECDGRKYDELASALGPFATHLPLQSRIEGMMSFYEVLHQVHLGITEDVRWQEFFSWQELDIQTANEREPFCAIGFEYWTRLSDCSTGPLSFSIEIQYSCTAPFEVKFTCVNEGEKLTAELQFDPRVFHRHEVLHVGSMLQALLNAAITSLHVPIAELDILSESERHQVSIEFNSTHADWETDIGIHDLITRSARSWYDRVAVAFEHQRLSYGSLESRSNQLASYLVRLGVGPETRVGISVEPSLEMVVGILGILKAGAAYVPLDPAYPGERLAFMIEDARVPVLLTQHRFQDNLLLSCQAPGITAPEIVCLDSGWDTIARELESSGVNIGSGGDGAYLIFTSGSTGKPKGILVDHRNLINSTLARLDYYNGPTPCFLLLSSFSFDSSVVGIFGTLSEGGVLLLRSERIRADVPELIILIDRHRVTHTLALPTLYSELLEQSGQQNLRSLQAVIVAGSACSPGLVEHHYQRFPSAPLFNEYGPTEATVWSTVSVCQPESESARVSIGRPVANTRVHLTDTFFQSLPIGIAGELVIGGLNLARGYLGRPDLTAERFVPDPFGDAGGSRLYRTGDVARHESSGQIEFLGRFDDQVKIRGYRIELGEIEAVLDRHPRLAASAVIVREDTPGDERLIAFMVARPGPAIFVDEIKAFIGEYLPAYMVPTVFVQLAEFPLTPNGKVDRQALAAAEQTEIERSRPLVKPRTPIEEVVAGSWSEVLGVDQIGIDDNFFELSGHSLNTTQVISRLSTAFNVDLPLRTMFESPTVAGMATRVERAIRERRGEREGGIKKNEREETEPMSYAQERLWFLHELEPESVSYNVPYMCGLKGELRKEGLEQSIGEVVRRHEVLRTTFETREGKAVQVIREREEMGLGVVDLGNLEEEEWERVAGELGVGEARRGFDLERGPMMRMVLMRRSSSEQALLLVMHHIISDGWSMGVLVREMGELYEGYTRGRPSGLEELRIQYADYAKWQREWMRSENVKEQEEYWRGRIGEGVRMLELPADRGRREAQTYEGEQQRFLIREEVSRRIRGLSREEGSTVFMTMLGGFKILLSRYSGESEVVVGTPIANRNQGEIEGLIGFFVNTLVLRTEVRGGEKFREVLRRVRETTLGAYANQDIPFEQIVEWVQPERDLRRSPIFQVMFILQNAPMPRLELRGLTLRLMEMHNETAKFDITMSLSEKEEGIEGAIEYNRDLFDRTTIQRMAEHYKMMLERIVERPDVRISEIEMMGEGERQELLVEWNDTEMRVSGRGGVHELIEKEAERVRDRIGVVSGEEQVSYGELNRRGNQLGRYLKRKGIRAEEVVGICVRRTVEMVVAMMGILKGGGAYLPLDSGHPRNRIKRVIEDAGARIVITDEEGEEAIRGGEWEEIRIDREWEDVGKEIEEDKVEEITGERLGYVIYTSGTTGKPKGVEVEHREIVNFVETMRRRPGIVEEDVMVAVTTISFDIAGLELMMPLTVGARVEVVSKEETRDGEELRKKVEERRGTIMQGTPATWRLLRDGGWEGGGIKILCGGEALSREMAVELEKRGEELWNLYGPTETTIWSMLEKVEGGEVTIGRPIGNTKVRIKNEEGEEAGVGIWGEIVIGGRGVARGYRGMAEMTAERFVPDGEECGGGRRAYRTGDIGRYLKDGRIEYQGRKDGQIKIRGYRIELGEIEGALEEQEWVREAVVTVREGEDGEKKLVAYVVPEGDGNGTRGMMERRAEQWRMVWDETYREGRGGEEEEEEKKEEGFNIAGWNNSYSGRAMPEEWMREWVERTVERIRKIGGRRVLEIGCGTGLLLTRLAAECERYQGTDFSDEAVEYVNGQLREEGEGREGARVERRRADDFEGMEEGSYDTVILNSVVQYFPSEEYLKRVIEGAVRVIGEQGRIFIGDVRSLPLLEAFHASVEYERMGRRAKVEELRRVVRESMEREEELVIDPEFFERLEEQEPKIGQVRIEQKRGRHQNEMTRFRYDVVIEVGGGGEGEKEEIREWMEWEKEEQTIEGVRRRIKESRPDRIGITGIRNKRVEEAVWLVKKMTEEGESGEEIGEVEAGREERGVDPEELWGLGEELGYEVEVGWGREGGGDGKFEVVMTREEGREVSRGERGKKGKRQRRYVNNPMQALFGREMAPGLKERLKERLPEYMVPTAYVMMEALPLTGSGKVDRKALPAAGVIREEREGYQAARTATEKELARIYEEVLGLGKVGVGENFFDLGGHSLLAMQVIARVRETLEVSIPLRTMFESPTVAGMATRVEIELQKLRPVLSPPIERVGRDERLPLAFAQQRLWFVDQLEPDTPAYNISTAVALTGKLNPSLVEQSIDTIIQRHETLRTTFPAIDAHPIQLIDSAVRRVFPLVDLSALPEAERRIEADHLARLEDLRPIDLAGGPVLRTRLLRLDPTEHLALFVVHHIVSDRWSMEILVREMTALCETLSLGKPSPLTELPVQYADYAVWQHRWLGSKFAKEDIAYWKEKLGAEVSVLELPADHPRPAVRTYSGAREPFELQAGLAKALGELAQHEECTLFMILLTAFKAMLQSYAGQREIVVGTDVAGRNRSELEGLIGLFVNQVVLRTDVSGDPAFLELLGRVREVVLEAFAHQDLPFDRLVSELKQERDLSRNPLFQVIFVMQNVPTASLELEGLTLRTLALDNKTSKFDLALFVEEAPNGLSCSWNFSTDLFELETIKRLTRRFEALLRAIVDRPNARLSELVEMLTQTERKERIAERNKRKGIGFQRFKTSKPKSVRLPQGQLVRSGYLDPKSTMPLVLQPAVDDVDLGGWVKANAGSVESELLKHGAILFRGFNIDSVASFERVASTICPDLYGDYGDLPREEISGRVYGATPYPSDQTILFHNESSHLHSWPLKIMFFCVQPPERGGETPIVDCRKIYSLLDPSLRERFAQKGLMYVRQYIDGLDVSWQSFFRTTDKAVVEEHGRLASFDLEWTPNGGLRTRRVGPAVTSHPKTGEMIFFNQLQLHHVSCLHSDVRKSLESLYSEEDFPRHVYYGDGAQIEESVVESICRLYRENSISFAWQRGDILVLDNMLGAHGRNPYVGARKIVVAMGEMFASNGAEQSSK